MSIGIDKLEIADEMMESAIECYLDQKRYLSALNLAGVAQEIYGKWIRINGGKDLPSQSIDNMEELAKLSGSEFIRKEYVKISSSPKNSIKHFDNKSDRYAILEPNLDSYIQMMEAYVEHMRLGRPKSENIVRFEKYIQETRATGHL